MMASFAALRRRIREGTVLIVEANQVRPTTVGATRTVVKVQSNGLRVLISEWSGREVGSREGWIYWPRKATCVDYDEETDTFDLLSEDGRFEIRYRIQDGDPS